MAMNRIYTLLILFVAITATPLSAQLTRSQQIVRTDTITRRDTVITTEIVKRTEIINRIEEVILTDTVYGSDGSKRVLVHTPVATPASTLQLTEITPTAAAIVQESPNSTAILEETPAGVTFVEASTATPENSLPQPVQTTTPIPADGGKYMWVPDSMTYEVKTLLAGHSVLIDDPESIDTNEKVLFRGDTIPMVLRDRKFGRFNRGLYNYLYIPKGIWQLGITASYGEFSTEDLEMFDLITDMDFQGKMFSVKPYFSYFFNNNMSAGLRLGYTYGRANVDQFNVDIDEDINFNLHDIMYRSESFSAALTFNQYFGILRRGRFAITNEVELAFSGGNSDFIRPFNSELKHTHTTTMSASLNFSPGLSVYIIEPMTFNISFGVFGFSLKNEKQTVDGEEMGTRFTSGANFRFNIFNINFGVAVNL